MDLNFVTAQNRIIDNEQKEVNMKEILRASF